MPISNRLLPCTYPPLQNISANIPFSTVERVSNDSSNIHNALRKAYLVSSDARIVHVPHASLFGMQQCTVYVLHTSLFGKQQCTVYVLHTSLFGKQQCTVYVLHTSLFGKQQCTVYVLHTSLFGKQQCTVYVMHTSLFDNKQRYVYSFHTHTLDASLFGRALPLQVPLQIVIDCARLNCRFALLVEVCVVLRCSFLLSSENSL